MTVVWKGRGDDNVIVHRLVTWSSMAKFLAVVSVYAWSLPGVLNTTDRALLYEIVCIVCSRISNVKTSVL